MARQFDIVIAGGGLVGCAAAALFARDGFSVAVVERGGAPSRHPRSPLSGGGGGDGGDGDGGGTGDGDHGDGGDSRVSAVGHAASALLQNLDAWPRDACAYRAMKVWQPGGGRIEFCARALGFAHLGHIVANRDLIAGLRANLQRDARATLFEQTEITAIAPDGERGLRVQLGGPSPESLAARLLVGADGARSTVRELAGITCRRRDFAQDAITATVAVDNHRHTAWQVFLDAGPAALLPQADGRCTLVWSCRRPLADELCALPGPEFCARLQAAFDGDGDAPGGITDCGRRRRFALIQHHADAYIAPSVALIGDAAHAIHPLAGLGANLGLADAAALAEVAAAAGERGRRIGGYATLRRYERRRRADNAAVVALMAALHDLFSARAPVVQFARAAGLNLTDKSPALKTAFAKFADRLAGDRPQTRRV